MRDDDRARGPTPPPTAYGPTAALADARQDAPRREARSGELSACVSVTVGDRRYAAELEAAPVGDGVVLYALERGTAAPRGRGWFAEGVLTTTAVPNDARLALERALVDLVDEERTRRIRRESDMCIILGAAAAHGLPAHARPAGDVTWTFLSQLNDSLAPADYCLEDGLRDVDFVLWTADNAGRVTAFALATLAKSEMGDRLEVVLPDRRSEPREAPLRVLLDSALILARRQRVKRIALRAARPWQQELAADVLAGEPARVGSDLCVFAVPPA